MSSTLTAPSPSNTATTTMRTRIVAMSWSPTCPMTRDPIRRKVAELGSESSERAENEGTDGQRHDRAKDLHLRMISEVKTLVHRTSLIV